MRPGDNVGQYTLVRYIGKGGMAEVWEARHLYLNKGRLALKFLLPQYATNTELQERFLKEAQRQLEHPNIISALDFFEIGGISYMVMHYVPPPAPPGQPESLDEKPLSLEDRLEEHRPLTVQEIRSISADLLSALDFAHSHGVVHRDVKPANVLLHRDGRALLTDFGIAKGLREERSMTRIGTSLGTPDYMSPEQIRRPTQVDARSDIYSFGCVLYAMLSRNPPFGSEDTTEYEIKDSHVRVTPPPLVYWNRGVPPAIGEVVFKCLEKDPGNRYQSCGAVMFALDKALEPEAAPAELKPVVPPSLPPAAQEAKSTPAPEPRWQNVRPPDATTAPLPARGSYSPTSVDLPVPPARKPQTPAAKPEPKPEPKHELEPEPQRPPLPPVQPLIKPSTPRTSSPGKFIAIGIAALVLLGAALFWQSSRKPAEKPDYLKLSWNDPRLGNCAGNDLCTARKAMADQLTAADWNQVRFDSPLFADCMGYAKCEEKKRQADNLKSLVNWRDPNLVVPVDCMGYAPCEQLRKARETKGKIAVATGSMETKAPPSVDPESLPSCCKDSPNPAQCKAQKKAAGIHGDCVLGH